MKNYLLLLVITATLAACEDPEPTPPVNNPPAPGPTYTASASYKEDGVLINCVIDTMDQTTAWYSFDETLTFTLAKDTNDWVKVHIDAADTGTYAISKTGNPGTDSYGIVSNHYSYACSLQSNDSLNYTTGTIKITKYDESNKRVSGTFSFDGCDNGVIVKVREGVFTDLPLSGL